MPRAVGQVPIGVTIAPCGKQRLNGVQIGRERGEQRIIVAPGRREQPRGAMLPALGNEGAGQRQGVEIDHARRIRLQRTAATRSSSRPSDTSIMAWAWGASARPAASSGTGRR